ncbi:Dihydrofolate synthase @ Folylpolyglutamate synthase [hydrothermal vent metagenome]|uniref:Dihydrofolate synthase @ Folylpolyglutamate synthase n=1 Tax=hydrothermal vent metagenome TaxID=652676 RepID=A0A3B1BL74_9ZZZZ
MAAKKCLTYRQSTAYLNSLNFHGIKLGLSRTEKLLEALGNPHRNYKVIHVAGTNGKGSTATMIASVLTSAGVDNGLYVSPHLETFRERIQINGGMIGTSDAAKLVGDVKKAVNSVNDPGVTYFEFMTAMAFLHFSRNKVKVAVVEVGLGGRFDSTNIVNPAVSIITSLAMDHQSHLGVNLKSIAYEKCGIIKQKQPVVCGVRESAVAQHVLDNAKKKSAPLFLIRRDFSNRRLSMDKYSEQFNFESSYGALKKVAVSLAGKQQVDNASCAIMALQLLRNQGVEVDDNAIRLGLADVYCPGRFEVVNKEPMVILDGAHNPKAAMALCHALRERFGEGKVDIIFGAMKDKDYKKMIANLKPVARSFTFFAPDVPRSPDPKELAEAQTDGSIPTGIAENTHKILDIMEKSPSDSLFLVTGSFYTVGEIRAALRRSAASKQTS